MAIQIHNFPQLKLLAWNVKVDTIEDAEAFALYERNWRHVDQAALTVDELALIERLKRECGNGVMNV